jgi:hypothetical protein
MAYYKNVFINNADNADILSDDLLGCSIESGIRGSGIRDQGSFGITHEIRG